MQIEKKYKLEKIVSKDPNRPSMNNIFVEEDKAFATNGTMLAVVPTTFEKGDTIGWLSAVALKLARRVAPKGLEQIRIELNGAQKLPDGTTLTRPGDQEKPPQLGDILKQARMNRKYKIGLNASYLKDLSEALGSDDLILEFGAPDKPIQITPVHGEPGTIGLLMPICLNP